jgi:hypothetical protein
MHIPMDETTRVQWWPVMGPQQPAAQERLSAEKIVPLTEDQAKALVGKALGDANEGSPYLVRGVYLWRGPKFGVHYANGELLVAHTSMGAFTTSWRPNRYALVVRLKTAPRRVVVMCGCAV